MTIEFDLKEQNSTIHSCRPEKTPEADGLGYEFFMILNMLNRCQLLNLFNNVLHNESTPHSWSKSSMILLHKKGDPKLVAKKQRDFALELYRKDLYVPYVQPHLDVGW